MLNAEFAGSNFFCDSFHYSDAMMLCRCLKVLICDQLMICICAYVPQTGTSTEERESLFLGSENGHVGINIDRYDGVHGGCGFGERNADGDRILEFCDAMELIVTNAFLKRQKSMYVSGGIVSTLTTCC